MFKMSLSVFTLYSIIYFNFDGLKPFINHPYLCFNTMHSQLKRKQKEPPILVYYQINAETMREVIIRLQIVSSIILQE